MGKKIDRSVCDCFVSLVKSCWPSHQSEPGVVPQYVGYSILSSCKKYNKILLEPGSPTGTSDPSYGTGVIEYVFTTRSYHTWEQSLVWMMTSLEHTSLITKIW